MKRNRHTITPTLALATQCVAGGFPVKCAEVIETSNRYTFVGKRDVIILKDIEEFCHFIAILQGDNNYDLMQSYRTNTCFVPTCEDIEQDLFEQGSIYKASLQQGTKKAVWTGITSPNTENLSGSTCAAIEQTHILPVPYFTTQIGGDVMHTMSPNNHNQIMIYSAGTLQHSHAMVNRTEIIDKDVEVESGVVYVIEKARYKSLNTITAQIENMRYFTIHSEVLD